MSKSNNPFNKIKIMQEDDDVEDLTTIPARLRRGFSKTGNNIELVGLARDFMLKDISLNSEEEFFAEKTEFTFTLPDLTKYPENFKAFLFKELVESSMLVSLEQEGHLNWWTDIGVCERLLPMVTCGDGNCLLHAASLSMWGFHDRVLALRRALNTVMLRSRHLDAFRRRWRHQQSLFLRSCELVLDENEWKKEWDLLVEVTSLEPRNAPRSNNIHGFNGKKQFGGGSQAANQTSTVVPSDAIYESLEEFHVFILCHIIKRPIIVMANPFLKNSQGENFSPVPFRGIYLPLERAPEDCCASPLLLAYNLGHFCALAAMQSDSSSANTTLNVPLVDCDMNLLPIHFLVDPSLRHGNEFSDPSQEEKLFMLKKYLEVNLIGERDDLLIDLGNGNGSTTSGSNPSNKTGPIHGTRAEVLTGFDPFKRRRSSLQSTKYVRPFSTSFDAQGVNEKKILCARLNVKKAPFANELVKNYLKEAQLRFEGMTRQKVGQLEEIRRRSKEGIKLRHIGQPSSHSGKLLNIFRSNNEKLDHANKSLASGTLPQKSLYPEQEIQSSMLTENLIPSATNSNIGYRRSAPIGFPDQNPSDVQLLGSVAKKEPSGAVKTIQKLLGQNKAKTEKSTFYTTKPSTTVVEGKSKFYTPLQETEVTNMEISSNNSSKDVRPNSSGAFKLPQIFQRIPSPSSSSALSPQADESNFSTFPSRSSTLRSASSSKTEENTSSLPKIKSKNKMNDQDWTRSYGFNASTSEPNIFDGELQNDCIKISSDAGGRSIVTNLNRSAGKTSSSAVLPCRSDGCTFFGSMEKSGYCSVCFAERGFEVQRSKDSNINSNRQSQQGYPFCQTKL